jgi:hypothetical protein
MMDARKRKRHPLGSLRLPMPPPGKIHSSKKGDKGYSRAKDKDGQRRERRERG